MRPRKQDRHLPSCVYLKSGSYYLVKGNKWKKIGSTLREALSAYSKIVEHPKGSVPALLDRFLASKTLASNTVNSYTTARNHLAQMFLDFAPGQITVHEVLEMQHHFRNHPGSANTMRTVLIGALDLAIVERLIDRNVARETKPLKTVARDRYITDGEYSRLYAQARDMMQIIMDLCYMTGQRIGDILAIRYADLGSDGISFKQGKTGHKMIVAWSPELRAVVERAKAYHKSVKGMTLLHSHDGKPYRYERIRDQWETICKRAEVEDAHIHDLRAKSGTDAKSQGMNSQALLGHTTESSHKRYLRGRDIPVVQALSIRKPPEVLEGNG